MGLRAWFCVVGLVVPTSLLAAATPAGSAQSSGGTLRISSTADVDSLDPALGYSDTSWWLEYATCAKLYNNPDKPGAAGATTIPEIARAFPQVSRDGRTQTIELRRNYRFHTGERVTAANFVAAFNRNASPKLQSPAASYMRTIVGVDAVIAGRARVISGVEALGAYTLRIRTTRPLPDLPARLAMPFFCPIAADTPLQVSTPLGSGPYYVASHTRNRQIVLERNPFYRGSRPAYVDRVVWSIGLGEQACLRSVAENTIDYCLGRTRGYGSAAEREIARRYGINRRGGQFFVTPTPQTFYFAFNHDRHAFKGAGQVPLKQAINVALDRDALVRAAGFLAGKATDQILPLAMTRPESIYPLGRVTAPNLRKAQALLARARYKPEQLVLYAPNDGFFPLWAQTFQRNLKRLGIDVVAKYFPFYEVARRAGNRREPFDVAIQAWSVDYADAITFFGPLLNGNNLVPTGNTNVAHFDRPRYNRRIERIDGLRGQKRRRAWADLDVEMMRNDPPWAPVMNGTQRDFVSRSFGCYVFQPMIGHFDIGAACKK